MRKRVTSEHWRRICASLPGHVQRVLGPEKNILLLSEMLRAAGSPDVDLPHCLTHGFALVGKMPLSHTLPLKERPFALDQQDGARGSISERCGFISGPAASKRRTRGAGVP